MWNCKARNLRVKKNLTFEIRNVILIICILGRTVLEIELWSQLGHFCPRDISGCDTGGVLLVSWAEVRATARHPIVVV